MHNTYTVIDASTVGVRDVLSLESDCYLPTYLPIYYTAAL